MRILVDILALKTVVQLARELAGTLNEHEQNAIAELEVELARHTAPSTEVNPTIAGLTDGRWSDRGNS